MNSLLLLIQGKIDIRTGMASHRFWMWLLIVFTHGVPVVLGIASLALLGMTFYIGLGHGFLSNCLAEGTLKFTVVTIVRSR